MYRYIEQAWKRPSKSYIQDIMRERVVIWRRQPTVTRIDKPTRLDRAHSLGYKAKIGFIVLRVRIRRGGSRKLRPILGHRPKRMGVTKYTTTQSLQTIAEQRAARDYPNLKLLNSYWVWQDGVNKWYEIIFVDPENPHIKADKEINWANRK
jgi:large subunit ribosomal protein L15e